MKEFTAKFGERIQGVISGFDRLVLRGSLRRLCYGRGMEEYLWQNKILSRITRNMSRRSASESRRLPSRGL